MESLSLMFICLGGWHVKSGFMVLASGFLSSPMGKPLHLTTCFGGCAFQQRLKNLIVYPMGTSEWYYLRSLPTSLGFDVPRWSRSSCGTALFRCEPEKSPRSLQLSSVVTRPMYGPSVFYDDLSDDLYGHPWTSFLVQFSFSSP